FHMEIFSFGLCCAEQRNILENALEMNSALVSQLPQLSRATKLTKKLVDLIRRRRLRVVCLNHSVGKTPRMSTCADREPETATSKCLSEQLIQVQWSFHMATVSSA